MRRTAIIATVITTAGLGAGAALAASGAAQAPGPPAGTKDVVVRQASFAFLDHPPKRHGDVPPSPGDVSIIGYRVFDAAGQQRLGQMDVICTSTDRRGKRIQCSGVMHLPDGDIQLAGSRDVAITGGTGAYAGARGIAESRASSGREERITLTFMP